MNLSSCLFDTTLLSQLSISQASCFSCSCQIAVFISLWQTTRAVDHRSWGFWLVLCNMRSFLSFNKICSAFFSVFSPKLQDILNFPLRYLRIATRLLSLLFSDIVFLFSFLFHLAFYPLSNGRGQHYDYRVARKKKEEKTFWRVTWITQLTGHRFSKGYVGIIISLNHF